MKKSKENVESMRAHKDIVLAHGHRSKDLTEAGTVIFFNKYRVVNATSGGQNMAKKSKKKKAAGREQHRQMKRAKKMQKKQRKKVELPKRHRKGKN